MNEWEFEKHSHGVTTIFMRGVDSDRAREFWREMDEALPRIMGSGYVAHREFAWMTAVTEDFEAAFGDLGSGTKLIPSLDPWAGED